MKNGFLKRKNIEISFRRYLTDALGSMALGLFASLLIGTIFNSIGQKFEIALFTDVIAPFARTATGPAIAAAIAYGLQVLEQKMSEKTPFFDPCFWGDS